MGQTKPFSQKCGYLELVIIYIYRLFACTYICIYIYIHMCQLVVIYIYIYIIWLIGMDRWDWWPRASIASSTSSRNSRTRVTEIWSWRGDSKNFFSAEWTWRYMGVAVKLNTRSSWYRINIAMGRSEQYRNPTSSRSCSIFSGESCVSFKKETRDQSFGPSIWSNYLTHEIWI